SDFSPWLTSLTAAGLPLAAGPREEGAASVPGAAFEGRMRPRRASAMTPIVKPPRMSRVSSRTDRMAAALSDWLDNVRRACSLETSDRSKRESTGGLRHFDCDEKIAAWTHTQRRPVWLSHGLPSGGNQTVLRGGTEPAGPQAPHKGPARTRRAPYGDRR